MDDIDSRQGRPQFFPKTYVINCFCGAVCWVVLLQAPNALLLMIKREAPVEYSILFFCFTLFMLFVGWFLVRDGIYRKYQGVIVGSACVRLLKVVRRRIVVQTVRFRDVDGIFSSTGGEFDGGSVYLSMKKKPNIALPDCRSEGKLLKLLYTRINTYHGINDL